MASWWKVPFIYPRLINLVTESKMSPYSAALRHCKPAHKKGPKSFAYEKQRHYGDSRDQTKATVTEMTVKLQTVG